MVLILIFCLDGWIEYIVKMKENNNNRVKISVWIKEKNVKK